MTESQYKNLVGERKKIIKSLESIDKKIEIAYKDHIKNKNLEIIQKKKKDPQEKREKYLLIVDKEHIPENLKDCKIIDLQIRKQIMMECDGEKIKLYDHGINSDDLFSINKRKDYVSKMNELNRNNKIINKFLSKSRVNDNSSDSGNNASSDSDKDNSSSNSEDEDNGEIDCKFIRKSFIKSKDKEIKNLYENNKCQIGYMMFNENDVPKSNDKFKDDWSTNCDSAYFYEGIATRSKVGIIY